MYGLELYGLVCRAVMLEGLSHRAAARRFGIDRGTVAKMMASPTPPGKMPVRRPKLADHEAFIEQILDDDERAPAKQRHTAQRIFERLRDERGFDGGYSTVRDYVRSRRQVRKQVRKEVFVPLAHPPGHAQADFGEATVVLGGVEQKVRFFVMVAIGAPLMVWMAPAYGIAMCQGGGCASDPPQGAIHGTAYHRGPRSGENRLPRSRRQRERCSCRMPSAASIAGLGVLRAAGAVPCRHGGLCGCPLLGAGVDRARPRSEAHAPVLREAVCEAGE